MCKFEKICLNKIAFSLSLNLCIYKIMHVFVHICIYAQTHACVWKCVYIYTYVCIYIYMYLHEYIIIYIHIYICSCKCVYLNWSQETQAPGRISVLGGCQINSPKEEVLFLRALHLGTYSNVRPLLQFRADLRTNPCMCVEMCIHIYICMYIYIYVLT